jgi:putative addiction module component (TIGR02574 family)
MPGERKGKMTIDQLTAAVLDLPPEQRALLREKLEDSLYPMDDIDPADLEEAHRRLDAMKSGRVKGVPFEELLDELDRMAL